MEISCHRNGVYHMFRTGDNPQICKILFWSVVRTHDLMSRFVLASFKDDPCISLEIVRFLAMSSGTEDVEILNTKISTVINESKATATAAKNAHTAATTASSKTDDLKKLFLLLEKRLAKVEK